MSIPSRGWTMVFPSLVASAVFSVSVVLAGPQLEVDALYERAKQALADRDNVTAIDLFRQLLERVKGDEERTWQMLLGVGRAYESTDDGYSAIAYYRRFLDATRASRAPLSEKWRERRRVTEGLIADLEVRLLEGRGRVAVSSHPDDARVLIDGQPVPGYDGSLAPLVAYLTAGSHRVRATAEGYEAAEIVVVVTPGEVQQVRLPLMRLPEARIVQVEPPSAEPIVIEAPPSVAPEPAPEAAPAAEEHQSHGPGALWGWVGLGVGGAAVGTAAALTGLALKAKGDQDKLAPGDTAGWDALEGKRGRYANGAYALWGVGGAALVGSAAYLLLFSDVAPWPVLARRERGLVPILTAGPSSDGAVLGATWRW